MGIRFYCPRGHKLNVKAELAGKIGICPECGQRMLIPFESTRESTHKRKLERLAGLNRLDAAQTPESTDSDEATITIHQPAANPYPAGAQIPPDLPAPDAEQVSASVSPAASAIDRSAAAAGDEEAAFPFSAPEPGATGIDANLLLADPNLVWYTRGTDNQSYGPVTNVVMKAWIKERRIGPTMLIWREGWSTWLEAKNVFPELEAIFTPPVAEVAVGASANPAPAAPVIVPESAPSEMKRRRAASKKKKKKETRDLALVIGLIAIIALLIMILVMILLRQPAPPAAASSIPLAVSANVPLGLGTTILSCCSGNSYCDNMAAQ